MKAQDITIGQEYEYRERYRGAQPVRCTVTGIVDMPVYRGYGRTKTTQKRVEVVLHYQAGDRKPPPVSLSFIRQPWADYKAQQKHHDDMAEAARQRIEADQFRRRTENPLLTKVGRLVLMNNDTIDKLIEGKPVVLDRERVLDIIEAAKEGRL